MLYSLHEVIVEKEWMMIRERKIQVHKWELLANWSNEPKLNMWNIDMVRYYTHLSDNTRDLSWR